MGLKDQIRRAAGRAFEFGQKMGLDGVLECRGRKIPCVVLERGREEVLMQGGYHVAREAALQVRTAEIQGVTQREAVVFGGERWIVTRMVSGPHGFTKMTLDREGV